jgi:hypothetical protein
MSPEVYRSPGWMQLMVREARAPAPRHPRICLQPPRLLSLVNRLCFSVTEWCFLHSYFLRVLSIARTSKKLTAQKCLASSTHCSNSVYHSAPPERCCQKMLATATTCCKTSMAGALAVLSVGPIAATIVVEEYVDGWPPGGAASGSGSGHHRS